MRALRFLPVAVLATVVLSVAPPAFASGGSGGGGGGGGGGTTLVTDPCATLTADAAMVNQGGVTSVRVTGKVTSCSDYSQTLYVQIEDQSGHLYPVTLSPPNTAGGACYICDSILGARKSWSFSAGWSVPADGTTYPFLVSVLHRDTMESTPILLASQTVSATAPLTRNA